ncbi:hypothetical protein LCGC14_1741840 [marine sediment metagenome]|uniref:Uncharacterized protein n=1 Tax=marine sediment metagenome TaxID=412755 RepID=A0A0F9K646_9ZZZZ
MEVETQSSSRREDTMNKQEQKDALARIREFLSAVRDGKQSGLSISDVITDTRRLELALFGETTA